MRGHTVVHDVVDLPDRDDVELMAELDDELERRIARVDAGEGVDVADVIAQLRAPR